MEQSHSLCESLVRKREEAQREAERLRTSFRDIERTLGTRERAHRHRVKGLEEQVLKLCCVKSFFSLFLPSSPGDTPDAGVPVALNKVVQNIYNLNVTQLDPSFIAYNRYDGSYLWARTRLCFFQHQ